MRRSSRAGRHNVATGSIGHRDAPSAGTSPVSQTRAGSSSTRASSSAASPSEPTTRAC